MVDIQARSLGKIYRGAEAISGHTQALKCTHRWTHRLRDLLVLEALEVAVLIHVVNHKAVLWFHPALRHKVELRVHVYSLHLSVVVVIRGKALVQ